MVPRHGAIVAALGFLAAAYVPWTWSDQLAGLGGDSAVYVLTARHFAPYVPADPVAGSIADESQFPPLYPALLAAGGGAIDLHLAHLVTTACLLAAFAAFYGWLVVLGLSRGMAAVIVALFAVMPGTFQQALQLKSESLYLALTLAGLALLGGASRARPDATGAWRATALFGAALLTRSAGVALLPALLVVLVRTRPKRWYWMPPLLLLPAVLWSVQRHAEAGYGQALAAYWVVPLPTVARQLSVNADAIVAGLASNALQTQTLSWVLVPLALISCAVLAHRLLRGQPDAWYAGAYLAMIIAWPYPSEAQRLGWVVLPLLLGYSVWGACQGAAAIPALARPVRAGLRWLAPLVIAVLIVPQFLFLVQRRFDPVAQQQPMLAQLPEWYGADAAAALAQARAHLEMAAALEELGPAIPPGQCLISIKPSTVAFYMRRDSFVPPFEWVDAGKFNGWIGRAPCRYYLLLAATEPPQFTSDYYPRDRLGERLEIMDLRTSVSDPGHRVVAAVARLAP
jgi:hypothetical protein